VTSVATIEPTMTTERDQLETVLDGQLPSSGLVDPGTARRLLKCDGFKPVGGPYDPNQTVTACVLPASTFSSVFMVPLLINSEQRAEYSYILTLLVPQYVCYFVCLITQGSFLVFVRSLTSDMVPPICGGGSTYLRVLYLSLSVAAMFKDILETFSMHKWVSYLPDFDPEVHNKILKHCDNNSGLTSLPFQKYCDSEGTEVTKPAAGISLHYRIGIYVFVLLPKLLFACILLVYGSAFVASGETNADLILCINAVAVVFILEVDDLVYQVLTPPMYKTWVETCSVITLCEVEQEALPMFLTYIGLFVIGGCVAGLFSFWC
jgi:hypothetical protein